jgi:hypothetical protein
MESERKEAGLLGVRFLYYRCQNCGTEDIFIDVLPREGESPEEYAARYTAMLQVARTLRAEIMGEGSGEPGGDSPEKRDVVVIPVKPPPDVALNTDPDPSS